MFYAWFVFFVLILIFGTLALIDWILPGKVFKEDHKKTKIVWSVIIPILFICFTVLSVGVSNPDSYRKDPTVSITEISSVYKCSGDTNDSLYYYVSKEGDDTLYELKVNKVLKGQSNYVITKEYSNNEIVNELVLKNKEAIKTLPSFNK